MLAPATAHGSAGGVFVASKNGVPTFEWMEPWRSVACHVYDMSNVFYWRTNRLTAGLVSKGVTSERNGAVAW
jgi:hypothetical protein